MDIPRILRNLLLILLLVEISMPVSNILCGGEMRRSTSGGKREGSSRRKGPADAANSGAAKAATESDPDQPGRTTSGESEYARLALALSQDQEEEKDVFVYRCKHIRGITLKKLLDSFITSSGSVAESAEADLVVVTDVKSNMPVIRQIARDVDQPVPQVLVEARIVELTIDRDFEKELNHAFEHLPLESDTFVKQIQVALGTPGANALTNQGSQITVRPYVSTADEQTRGNILETFLRYLESRGKARILSAPNLILRRGSEGNIITGEQIPILTQTVVSGSISTSTVFKSVGIKLKVEPISIRGDTVRLAVSPEVSTVRGYSQAGEGISNPIIAVRNATTELEVKDKQIISIGGLMRQEERKLQRRVPILGSVPVMGHLFRSAWSESIRSQLVIFLTLHILDEAEPGDVVVHRPGETPEPIAAEIEHLDNTLQHPPATIGEDIRSFRQDGAP